MPFRTSLSAKNAVINGYTALFNKGANPNNSYINIYSDATSQPATADTAVPGGSVLLVQIPFASTAFSTSTTATGVATGLPISGVTVNSGNPSWFRFFTGASTPASLSDGTVTVSGGSGNMTFDQVPWSSGATVILNTLNIITS